VKYVAVLFAVLTMAWLLFDCVTSKAAPSAASAAVAESSAPGGLATWVWDEATVVTPATRRELLEFVRAKGVDNLFVHAAADYERDGPFEALAQLVSSASQQRTSVMFVGGDPSWGSTSHRSDALAFLDRARRLETRLADRGLSHWGRVLFDIEPYLLPAWKTSPQDAAAQYADTLRSLRAASRAATLEVWHTIPFWFPTYEVEGRSLDRIAIEQSDRVIVMAYRNSARDVQSIATPILEHASELGKRVVVAIETECVEPSYVTFCGKSADDLEVAIRDLESALSTSRAFAGLAVHSSASWRLLDTHPR
jgi:hypothetical protein